MAKLIFPEDGLYNLVNDDIELLKSNLTEATKYTSFSIPSGFSYRNYLANLGSLISGYQKETEVIIYNLKDCDANVEQTVENLVLEAKELDKGSRKTRERMII